MSRSKLSTPLGIVANIVRLANPVVVLLSIVIPTGALIYAVNFGSLTFLNYVHVLFGGMWTGIDLFMGFVLGPVLGGMDPKDRAAVFKRLVPRMTFLMPVLAMVTITSAIELSGRLGYPLTSPKLVISGIITGILTIQGFGFILPNEVRVFQQLLAEKPDLDRIARLGMRTARLGGLQGLFQLAIIFVMSSLRF